MDNDSNDEGTQNSSGLEQMLLIIAIVVTILLIIVAVWLVIRLRRQRRMAAMGKKEFNRIVWEMPTVPSTEATTVTDKTTVNDTVVLPAGGTKSKSARKKSNKSKS